MCQVTLDASAPTLLLQAGTERGRILYSRRAGPLGRRDGAEVGSGAEERLVCCFEPSLLRCALSHKRRAIGVRMDTAERKVDERYGDLSGRAGSNGVNRRLESLAHGALEVGKLGDHDGSAPWTYPIGFPPNGSQRALAARAICRRCRRGSTEKACISRGEPGYGKGTPRNHDD